MAGMALAALVSGESLDCRRLFLAGGASLCLYGFGLILNDLHDFETDRIYASNRPLPRREISLGLALSVALLLLLAGLLLAELLGKAALLTGSVLAVLVMTYNFGGKQYPLAGSVNMGLCRGASFLLGVNYTWWLALPGVAALGVTAFIAAVTAISRHEETEHRHGLGAWVPFWILLAMYLALLYFTCAAGVPRAQLLPLVLLPVAGLLLVGGIGRRLARGSVSPDQTRVAVGEFIRALILIQVPFLCLLPATVPFAVALLVGWSLAKYLGKTYSGS